MTGVSGTTIRSFGPSARFAGTLAAVRNLVAFLLAAWLASGCYFGRTPRAKLANYLANGAVAVIGVSVMVEAALDDDQANVNLTFSNFAVGSILIGAAALTALVTYLVPTKPRPPAPARADRR